MCVQPELHGMVPVEGGQFGGLQRMAMRWPNRLKQAAAVCNSLTLINRKQVVGDAADKQAFKAVEAQFVVRCCSCCLQQRDCRCAACDPDAVARVLDSACHSNSERQREQASTNKSADTQLLWAICVMSIVPLLLSCIAKPNVTGWQAAQHRLLLSRALCH